MKVVAFNGSPKKEGNTYQAIRLVAAELEAKGIAVEIIHVGNQTIAGCRACNACMKGESAQCVINDPVNGWVEKMKQADGLLFGSPVHYAGVAGTMKSFLDRAFYLGNRGLFRHKVAAAVVAVRRSGGVTTLDQLNHYIHYAEMVVPTTNYWNVIHGMLPGEALADEEGKQILRILGRNMAWVMELIEKGKGVVEEPTAEAKILMNFIR